MASVVAAPIFELDHGSVLLTNRQLLEECFSRQEVFERGCFGS